MKRVVYSRPAEKVLRRMPKPTAVRIRGKVEAYAADPASMARNVKALVGSPYVRLRVGDWRVIMEDGVVIFVVKVDARGGVYKGA